MILGPISAVTMAARAVSRGDLDQVVPAQTRDELGELGHAFIRWRGPFASFERRALRSCCVQRTAQATIDSFPDPVVVVDPQGVSSVPTPPAQRLLHAVPRSATAARCPGSPRRT